MPKSLYIRIYINIIKSLKINQSRLRSVEKCCFIQNPSTLLLMEGGGGALQMGPLISHPLSSCLSSAGLRTPPPSPNLIGLLAGGIEHNRHQQLQLPSAPSASAPPPWPLPLLAPLLLLLWTQLLPLRAEPLAASHTSLQTSHSIFRL